MSKDKPKQPPTIELVKVFHSIFGHPIAESLTPQTKEMRELRVKLIAEELGELCVALGVKLNLRVGLVDFRMDAEAHLEDLEVDLVEAADALGDLDYVVAGANLVFGIPADLVINEIQRANMSKLGEDGKPIYREDGKIMKGPNYRSPDINSILYPGSNSDVDPAN
jgi:predicted HAD superfamily Cof-like phosphohydrolase